MRRIGAGYLAYMNQMFEFSEDIAQQVFGRDVKQTLLIHANALNAEYYHELTQMMKKRGYALVTLSDASKTPPIKARTGRSGREVYRGCSGVGPGKPLDESGAPQIPPYIRELNGS